MNSTRKQCNITVFFARPVAVPSDTEQDYLLKVNQNAINWNAIPLVSSGQDEFPTGSLSANQEVTYHLVGKEGSKLLFVKDVRTIDQTKASCGQLARGRGGENLQRRALLQIIMTISGN